MRKIAFIINPVAGNGKTVEAIKYIKDKMIDRENEIQYEIHLSKYRGDVSNLAKELSAIGYTEFVAVGGDGTVSELINGLIYREEIIYKIGVIPWGTGNDLVRSLEIPNDINEVLDIIVGNAFIEVDLGIVNDQYFINVASFGIDGQIIKDTEKLKKIFPGHPAYYLSTLKAGISFKPEYVTVEIDGKSYSGNMILIAVGNGKYFGGGMKICPNAKMNDGVFDICLVNNVSKIKFMKEINKVYSGRLGEIEEVIYLQGKEILIHLDSGMYDINIDGNLVGKTPVKIEISPYKVKMFTNIQLL